MAKDKQARVAPVRVAADRISVASRVERTVHEDLQRSAAAHGRTLSEEIERRLTNSVRGADLVADIFSSRGTLRLIEGVARTAEMIESDYPGADWRTTPTMAAEMRVALERFIKIAMEEDRGPNFYPTEWAMTPLRLQADDPLPYDYHRAQATAETVATILGFKSLVPDPREQLRSLEAMMAQESPELLARWKQAQQEQQIAHAGSAQGPQEKSASKQKRSKSS